MGAVQENPSTVIQISLFESITGMLLLKPIFLLGIVIICILLAVLFKKNNSLPKMKISIASLILYYYLCLLLTNIVGIPTMNEFIRLSQLGESLFHPKVNFLPFSDGFSLSFILNIFLFIPLGFLCPIISKTYERAKNIILLGFGLSLSVEVTQLFTLYRVTDINDLLTNVLGTVIGYLCFQVILKFRSARSQEAYPCQQSARKHSLAYLPVMIIGIAFVLGFFS